MIVLRRRVKSIIQIAVALVAVTFILLLVSSWNSFSHRELDNLFREGFLRKEGLISADGKTDISKLLEEAFGKADVNADKLLTASEIETWIVDRTQEHLNDGEAELAKMFLDVDMDQSGYASWTEFSIWFKKNPKKHGKKSLEENREEWNVADSSHDGMLERQEFQCFRHPELCEETLRQLTQEVIKNLDKNSDGFLTEDEYIVAPPGQVEEGFQDYEDKFKEQRKKEFFAVDKNKDGVATEDELSVFLNPRNHIHAKTEAEELIDAADENEDGRLSFDEVIKHKDLFEQSKLMDFPPLFRMTLLRPERVLYRLGPEHFLPYASLPFLEKFSTSPPFPKNAFAVFQEKLKELGVDDFPYRLPVYQETQAPAWKHDKASPTDLRSRSELVDEKKLIMEWKNSPWYKECKWSDDYDQLQYKLLRAKKPLRMQTIFQQFQSLNLCNCEITDIGTDLIVLKSLQTLSLGCNRLTSVHLEILPSGLKHLELFGNLITKIWGYCPEYLRHLGLASNGIVNPLSIFSPSDLRPLVSIDLGENMISGIDDCVACLVQFPQLDNLRAAGNPISLMRSYRVQLVNAVKPRLLCIDGDEISEADRLNYQAISYELFPSALKASHQCVILFAIEDILGAPQPAGYKTPAEQTAYPLAKWAYTVEIAFPGSLLPTKPALPPPSAETLKNEEKTRAKKAKTAKTGKKGYHTPPPPDLTFEPEDPFYAGLTGMQKVVNDGFDWVWAEPSIVAGTPVPLLVSGDKPTSLLYEYFRRGMKVKIFLKRVLYAPVAMGKKSMKPKVPKSQKPDLWAVPLASEVADSVQIAEVTIPLIQLLHGDPEVKFQCVINQPLSTTAPATPGLKKKQHPSPGGKEGKSRQGAHSKMEDKGPMIVNMRVRIHHDQTPADLFTYPPEIPPYVAPEGKPLDAHPHPHPHPHPHNSTPKSASPNSTVTTEKLVL